MYILSWDREYKVKCLDSVLQNDRHFSCKVCKENLLVFTDSLHSLSMLVLCIYIYICVCVNVVYVGEGI